MRVTHRVCAWMIVSILCVASFGRAHGSGPIIIDYLDERHCQDIRRDYTSPPQYYRSTREADDLNGLIIAWDFADGSYIYTKPDRAGTYYHINSAQVFVAVLGRLGQLGELTNHALGVKVSAKGKASIPFVAEGEVGGEASYQGQWGNTVSFAGITNEAELEELWEEKAKPGYGLDIYVRVLAAQNARDIWIGSEHYKTEVVTVPLPARDIVLVRDKRLALAGGNYYALEVAPFLKGGRLFVPVRFVSEAFGFDVRWCDDHTSSPERVDILSPHSGRLIASLFVNGGEVRDIHSNRVVYTARPEVLLLRDSAQGEKEITLDVASEKRAGKVMVPVRAMLYILGQGDDPCVSDGYACDYHHQSGTLVLPLGFQ
ncbi:MAG: stalk domain-containing protein [Bacillota bacterium]